MLNEQGKQNAMKQIHDMWIAPEVERRRAAGLLPDDFKIRTCLIKLPHDKPPIIEFNEQVGWRAEPRMATGVSLTHGEAVYLHEIAGIETVEPPEVDGERVAFVFLFWTGMDYSALFDFTPNWDDEEVPAEAQEWAFGKRLAEYIEATLTERVMNTYDVVETKLRGIGLWAAPTLLPYPLSKIIVQLDAGDADGARATLVSHCTPAFIREMAAKWWEAEPFAIRRKLIEEAVHNHEIGYYHSSIHTLMPHAEGIVTDWEYTLNLAHDTIPFRVESKTKKFRDIALGATQATYLFRRVVESASAFVLDGPFLSIFKKWMDDLDPAFPGRHPVEHGRYDERLFTEENSIKMFLLLDTIYQIISAYPPPTP
jgi:hypothetical protein